MQTLRTLPGSVARRRLPCALFALVLGVSTLSSCATCSSPEEPEIAVPVDEPSVRPGLNDNYVSPDLDVAEYEARFETESREIFAERDAIVAVLEPEPGLEIADVGAGTGLFTELFAGRVGPTGHVWAVDIAPNFVAHLEARKRLEGWSNVSVVACTERSAELPRRSVDVVFVCDTYHHFEYPRSTLASLRRALRPQGRLVVVDFERIPGVSRDWILEHVRAGKEQVRAEIEAAGFRFEREDTTPGLQENYLLLFRAP